MAAFIDAEHALDVGYARKLGVNIEELLVSQPDYGEQALEIADTLVRSGAVDMIVVDSVAALVPKAEIEGEMGDSHVGLQARLMSQALRKLTGNVHRSNVTLFFINQIRMKIGVMFGSPETTTGGNALKFYASDASGYPSRRCDQGRRTVGLAIARASKWSRTSWRRRSRECEFDMLYGEGISQSGDLIDLAVTDGILEKSGAWFSYGDERVGQGRENARNYLQERPKLLAEIEAKILQKHGLSRGGAAESAPANGGKSAAASVNGEAASSKSNAPSSANNASQANGAAQKSAANANNANNEDDAKSRAAAAAAAARPRPRA